MSLSRYALVNADGSIGNFIEFESTPEAPTDGTQFVLTTPGVDFGWVYANGVFTNPNPPPAPTANQIALAQIKNYESQQTDRMYREALAGSTAVDPKTGRTSAQQLVWLDQQIVTLRASLS